MSINKAAFDGVRLLFSGPSNVILNSFIRNHSTTESKVNVSCLYSGSNALYNVHNQLIPYRSNVFARIHTSDILFKNTDTTDKKNEVEKAKKKEVVPAKNKKPLKQRIMDELRHYYQGFKLLFINSKIALKLILKRFGGQPLSRREHKLLKRTAGDIFRLLPFSIFVIVPFMELALPIFLKLFPGMLPSTFLTKKQKRSRARRSFKAKLELSKFLHETLDEMTPQIRHHESSELAKDFSEFFQKIRTTGEMPSTHDILKYSKLFEDEITLDRLSRAQIIALCRYLNLPAIGTTRFLRYQLKSKIRNIQIDDKIILREGLHNMSYSELREACRSRGMRFFGIDEERLREQLQLWLDLSLVKKIPPSLLLLSQAFSLTNKLPNESALAATIKSLPVEVGTATKAVLSEREGTLDYETSIYLLKDELKKIAEENREWQLEMQKISGGFMMKDTETEENEEMIRHQLMQGKINEEISINELAILEDALTLHLYIEKDCLAELKNDLENYDQRILELKEVMSKFKKSEIIVETLAARRLHKKLRMIIKKLDDALQLIDQRETEMHEAEILMEHKDKRPGTVSIDELINKLRDKRLGENLPLKAESQIAYILNKLDSEKDGYVRIRKVSKLLDQLNNEESLIDLQIIEEYIKTINKEERLENLNRSENYNSNKG